MQNGNASAPVGGDQEDAAAVPPLRADGCDGGQLSYGMSTDGKLLHVSEVERGLRCGCRCAACGCQLIARRGEIRVMHFAHHAAAECVGAWETTLHLLAKEVLKGASEVLLPEAVAAVGGRTERVAKAVWFAYADVGEEVNLGSVRPDIVVTGKGRELLVEVAVTHFCDTVKIAKLRERNLPAIEIDLSRVARPASREQHALQILRNAPRIWLHNAKLVAAEARLQAVADRHRADREAKKRLAWEGVADTLAKVSATPKEALGGGWIAEAREAGLERLIGLPVEGDFCFGVTTETWQARFLGMAVNDRRGETFDAMDAIGRLRQLGLLRQEFDRPFVNPDETAFLRDRVPGLRPPIDVIRAYAKLLIDAGFLSPVSSDLWFVPHVPLAEARDRALRAREARMRLAELRRLAASVKEALGPTAKDTLRACASTALHEGGPTPLELAATGGDAWKDLVSALKDAADMTKPGGVPLRPDRLLNLPLEGARAARIAEESERRARRDADRRKRAKAFIQTLIVQADRWFDKGNGAEWARERLGGDMVDPGHDDRFEQNAAFRRELEAALLEEGNRYHRKRQAEETKALAEAEAVRVVAVARADLFKAATSAFIDQERASLWMRSRNPALGGSPQDICVEPTGMTRCMRALETVRGNARRR
jgi:hypothetical protein